MKYHKMTAAVLLAAMLVSNTAFAAEVPEGPADTAAAAVQEQAEEEGPAGGTQEMSGTEEGRTEDAASGEALGQKEEMPAGEEVLGEKQELPAEEEAAETEETEGTAGEEETVDTGSAEALQVAKKNGWVTEKGKTYYYENGKRHTGMLYLDEGTYYMSYDDGHLITGYAVDFYTERRAGYYFSPTAKNGAHAGYMVTGWVSADGNTRYFLTEKDKPDEDSIYYQRTGTLVRGWYTINGFKYYFGEEGEDLYDQDEAHYNDKIVLGGIQATGWRKIGGKTYYFWPSTKNGHYKGVMVTGWQTINGYKYYFGKDGVQRTGFQTVGGKKYYFFPKTSGKNYKGTMAKNWQTIDGKTYYFGSNGVMRTGWQTINGWKYYFGTNGAETKGFKTIDGKKYYFYDGNKAMKGYARNKGRELYNGTIPAPGFISIGGADKVYYIQKDGSLATGRIKTEDGSWSVYEFDKNGLMISK